MKVKTVSTIVFGMAVSGLLILAPIQSSAAARVIPAKWHWHHYRQAHKAAKHPKPHYPPKHKRS